MPKEQSVSRESLLSSVKPSKAIINLAIPATLALLAKAVYNIVDTAYIGMLGSDTALAAVGVTGIYFSQPAADVLTILICLFLVGPMKRMASQNMFGNAQS